MCVFITAALELRSVFYKNRAIHPCAAAVKVILQAGVLQLLCSIFHFKSQACGQCMVMYADSSNKAVKLSRVPLQQDIILHKAFSNMSPDTRTNVYE